MTVPRIAIIGGGISGLTLAYELARRGHGDSFTLFEQNSRLGGIVETVRQDGFIVECGPDAWLTEKPWARDLACELGLEQDLLPSRDASRRTYILQRNELVPIPAGMRLMVPTDLDAAARSPLFSPAALAAFQAEMRRFAELRGTAPSDDESVATFVDRHFGPEVLHTVAAPLLSGIFGGDVRRLSARAVLPQLVALERRHGSLILGLQHRSGAGIELPESPPATTVPRLAKDPRPAPASLFTTLRSGLGTLVDVLTAHIPDSSIRRGTSVHAIANQQGRWIVSSSQTPQTPSTDPARPPDLQHEPFDAVVLATPLDTTRHLLAPVDSQAAGPLPSNASSAIVIAFAWRDLSLSPRDCRRTGLCAFATPRGFGFLVPPRAGLAGAFGPQLLATTFAHQKFSDRAPNGGILLRAFYGGPAAERLWHLDDARLTARALAELRAILGPLPASAPLTVFRRWHNSLPQYEVGHLERIADLEIVLRSHPGLHLLGNSLIGVGLPDLVREARALAPSLLT